MLDITPQEYAAQKASRQIIALLVELEYSLGAVRCWSGVGPLYWQGVQWTGVGYLAGVQPLRSAIDGRTNGLLFQLNGLPIMHNGMNLAAYVDNYTRRGGFANCWLPHFDLQTYQIVPEPMQLLRGKLQEPTIEIGLGTFSVAVAVESARARSQRPRALRLTNETQRIAYPDDRFLEYVVDMQDTSIL